MMKVNIICSPIIYTSNKNNPKISLSFDIKRDDSKVHEIPHGYYIIHSIAVISNDEIEDVTMEYVKEGVELKLRDVLPEIISDYGYFDYFNYI